MASRRERVVLELEDQFTTGMARAAASAALLNRELDSLSRDSVRTRRSISDIDSTTTRFGRNVESSGREVDKLSGRMRILTDVAAVLGPSLIPIGAVGVPAITGLAAQLGFAATAAGTTVLAFQGVGNALKTLNTAALHPTALNLSKAQVALEQLSPQAQDFVAEVGRMIPELTRLRDVAAAGLFPGLTAGLSELQTGLPHVADVISAVSTELGSIAADAGASLASPKWADFLDFVAQEAPSALADMAKAAGHTAHAVAELWMATDPLNDDFSQWLVKATTDIDRWASSLAKTQGFADFIAYVETTGPKVAAAFGAIANAAIQILQAMAPLGGPVLDGIKALADIVASIADSDLGTPLFTAAAALALFNRTMAATSAIQRGTLFGTTKANFKTVSAGIRGITADLALMNRQSLRAPTQGFIGPLTEAQTARGRLSSSLAGIGKATALIGGLTVASTGAADKIGLTNAASLALMGTLGGPWGAAVGGAAGLLLDAKSAGQGFADAMTGADRALKSFDTSTIEAQLAKLEAKRKDLTNVTGVGDFFSDRVTKALHSGAFSSKAIDELDAKIEQLKGHLTFTRGQAEAKLLADGFVATADGIDGATSSTQNFERELEKLNDVLAGRASFRDFEQSIDDFTDRQKKRAKVLADIQQENADYAAASAKTSRELAAAQKSGDKGRVADIEAQRAQQKSAHDERIKQLNEESASLKNSLDTGTQAGRDTQALLDNIAATALKVAQGLDPIKRTEFLAGARTEYVKAAIDAGMAKDAAEALADSVLGLSKVTGQPKIIIDPSGAWRVITETERRLAHMRGRELQINIVTNFPQGKKNQADFLDIHGYAGGGWTGPGEKFQPAGVVHAEEFVVKRGPAAQFRPWLESLNRLPGYADGGMVQRFPTPAFASAPLGQHDIDRIVQGLASVRPVFGDVHLSGDGAFEREQRQRLAAFDGVRR